MSRFFFHFQECGEHLGDEEGRELASFETAYAEAILAARMIMAEEIQAGRLRLNCSIEIADSDGNSPAAIPFSEAICSVD